MVKFVPVFLAFLLNSSGINIFRENSPGCEPLISCLIFLLAVFILLWDIRLYPGSLRKLSRQGNLIVEFLLVDFIMEYIMADFWFPLEASMSTFLPKVSEFEQEILKQGGWDSGGLFSFLAWEATHVVFSYALSIFFLFAVLHATRVVDYRLLTCGFGVFFRDILQRIRKFKRKVFKCMGVKKSVKFKFDGRCKSKCSNKSFTSTVPSSGFDPCNENFGVESDDDCLCCDDDCLNSFYKRRKF